RTAGVGGALTCRAGGREGVVGDRQGRGQRHRRGVGRKPSNPSRRSERRARGDRRLRISGATNRAPRASGGPGPWARATAVVWGGWKEVIQPNRLIGSTMSRALPITLSTGIGPWPGTRESDELLRLSPIIQSWPSGTVTGPNGSCRGGPASGR